MPPRRFDKARHQNPSIEVSGRSDQFAQTFINRMGAVRHTNGFECHGELKGGGFGTIRKLDLRAGLNIEIFDHFLHIDSSSKFHLVYPSLRFVFFLYGDGHLSAWSHFAKTKSVVNQMVGGLCSVGFFPELEGAFRIKRGSRYVQVTVNIAPSILKGFLQDNDDGLPRAIYDIAAGADNVCCYHISALSKPMFAALHEILFCPYSGSTRKIFLESKALELVSHKLAQFQYPSSCSSSLHLTGNKDMDNIYMVESLMSRDLEKPPSLYEMACLAGMSPQKLNAGFREIFGTTVFGHLRRIRLERARFLMEKQGKNVTEAALAVGYSSMPSFSKAFSHHFMICPKECLKTR